MKKQTAAEIIESLGLPSAPQSEQIVLSLCLGDQEMFDQARFAIDETCFTDERKRRVWVTLCEVRDSGMGVDRCTVAQYLHDRGKLESVGGIGYLVDLEADTPRGIALEPHIRSVQEKTTLRRTLAALNTAMLRCLEPGNDSAEVVAYAQELLDKIEKEGPSQTTLQRIGDVIEGVGIQEFCSPTVMLTKATPLPEEWPGLRRIYPLFRPGQLIVLGGFTSQGKSALALHIAVSRARAGYPVAMFSMEMDRLEISHRAASHLSEVDSYAHQNGRMSKEERLRYQAAVSKLNDNFPLFIDDRTGSTVPAIAAAVAKMKPKPRLVIVDYLQIMESVSRPDTRAAAVSEISRGLKRLATQFQVPVIALSQFNRDAAKQGRRPELHDLRESGSIEQDANVALLLHAKKGQEHQPFMDITVDVAKNRGGRKGEVQMLFKKPFSMFVEIEKESK